jgi:tRNA(His) 5'-end guanylyltransferase
MELADRMKRYESVFKSTIMPKTPAIIRIDGKAFHTWTKG